MKLRHLAVAAALFAGGPAMAQDPLDIAFTVHSNLANTFWQAVQKGYEDACDKIGANCQMVYVQTDGSVQEQVANMEAAISRQPDALITSIVDNNAFDDVIQRARDAGIIVIASNVDDLEGAKGNARQAFVGQGFVPAGHSLAAAQWKNMPAEGDLHILVGVSAPGQNWSEQRALGITNFLDEADRGESRPQDHLREARLRHRPRDHRRPGRRLSRGASRDQRLFRHRLLACGGGAGADRPRRAAGAGAARRLRPRARGARPDEGRATCRCRSTSSPTCRASCR